MPWGAVAGAVIGAYSADQQSKSAKKAANLQAGSSDKASQVQWDMYSQSRRDSEPWRQAGLTGLNEYMSLLVLSPVGTSAGAVPTFSQDAADAYLKANPDVAADAKYGGNPWKHYMDYGRDEGRAWGAPTAATTPAATAQSQQAAFDRFRSQPGYAFGMSEGLKATQASAAARGGLNSGATLKALMKYGRDYSDQQGYTPYMNRLASLSGIGQTQANQNAALGQGVANQVGANMINAGQARAQGTYDSTNAWSNFGAQAANSLGQADWSKFGWGGV